MNNRTATYSFVIGATLLFFIASIVLVTSTFFLLGIPVTAVSFWLSVLAALVCLLAMTATFVPLRRPTWLVALLAGLAIVIGGGWYISANTFDLSFDGQTYHQEAIILLTNGWNPVHDAPILKPPGKPIEEMDNKEILSAFHLWINHYAKGPWMLDAVMYKVTNQIEVGKIFNLLLMAASFFLSLAALRTAFPAKKGLAVVLAILAACNPVVVSQATSFYIDGQLGSLVLIICALGYLLLKRYHTWTMLALCSALMLLAQIKFTALVYAVLLGGALLVLFFFCDRQKRWKTVLAWLAASLVITVVVVGYNPYVTNTLAKGHPFYPLAGKGAVDIMTSNSPHDFKDINSLSKLGISLFAQSENIATPKETTLKWPFTFSEQELKVFLAPDVRVAGFGPWFGGAVLLAFLIVLALLFGRERRKALPLLVASIILLITVLINPESWWARYVPQLWLIPLLVTLAGWDAQAALTRYGSRILLAVMLVNMLLVGSAHMLGQRSINAMAEQQLQEIKASNKTMIVDFRHFNANRIRLQEAGIPYIEQKVAEGQEVKGIISSRAIYYLQ
ncbi:MULTISPECIES: hypothetical protein [Brevibacillus]|uniref:Glycosyltransferase RgtA/B/C/D-like domain-containing protein n=1 Tax=Brevibacillus parabrevis TaxID=54914 RepID=A0A4Y3PL94_BREPA|nr:MULTISPECIES: hypothetical protein [Brevibacillus]MED2255823.1 hypothetical protein [Brevibacillus parabrevis]NRQ55195.1 hypothetical protein [Brevibacillus sp. HD1.4A]RNB97524.1 hypothetical protein EDM60_01460 [Brevibacillus parabrevis]GEB33615.1 hypothetical protein BPA01_31950 [Brevibacillus parabrevis]HBZ81568.1 hypothetical protein [Brevibacillus sp.]